MLNIRAASSGCIRVTLKPETYAPEFPETPVLPERSYPAPALTLQELTGPVKAEIAALSVEVLPEPLRIVVSGKDGTMIQTLTFGDDGNIAFALDDQPVLGLGEGGPETPKGVDWHKVPVEFDRRGRLDRMEPKWQREAYGSRNPVALLAGTRGWGLYFATPWGQIDLSGKERGYFIPIKTADPAMKRQNFKNQGKQLGKGLPPLASFVPGLIDCFIFDARNPATFMKAVSDISGPAVMPPKWALGYMQSHRTLEDDVQMTGIVDTFRQKHLPLDAVIYLGTGFVPRGWNTPQPSLEFNPQVFKSPPESFIAGLHARHVKVALHIVPWDRDRLPTLQGSIPPLPGETVDSSHIADYWNQHLPLVKAGVDAWWPDEGDWLDLFERMKRHQTYYQGPILTQPDRRPWNLQRNGHLGIARWGGWIWSGDTDASWKTLEAQIAVGLNHSLSLSPYWGSDLGGFWSGPELTGELYARWFQFAAFCPSFRAHGRTWQTRLPWGWGTGNPGPLEDGPGKVPLASKLNNATIEPIARTYDELRYRLLSYNYTLAWQARSTGLPLMRALWLHYPDDRRASATGSEYLWGRDLLIAPVFEKSATVREVYLPAGAWYDWWNGEKQNGGRTVSRPVDLATMPIYVRSGAILPLDPIRQYTGEKSDGPLTLRVYRGADGDYSLYEDDGDLAYLKGDFALTKLQWDDEAAVLSISPETKRAVPRRLRIEMIPDGVIREVDYTGHPLRVGVPFKR